MRKRTPLFVAVLCFLSGPSYAANFNVNSPLDSADSAPGDGLCQTQIADECTLRAAVMESNALPGADRIDLPAGHYLMTLAIPGENTGSSGDFDILDDLVIVGETMATTTVDAQGIDRVFQVHAGVSLHLERVTVQNGQARLSNGVPTGAGGGVHAVPGSTLSVQLCTFRDNGGSDGAGIGGAADSLIVQNSTIEGNHGNLPGIATLSGDCSIRNSTIANNSGGISVVYCSGNFEIENSTLSENNDPEGFGPFAVWGLGTVVKITNSTITGHEAGGLVGEVALNNTIVANNPGGDCFSATIVSGSHNLDSDGSCGLSAPGDLSGVDPLLMPLAKIWGPSPTHDLLPGSPAIDAADDAACPARDQRGFTRPAGPHCDIGSVERIVGPSCF